MDYAPRRFVDARLAHHWRPSQEWKLHCYRLRRLLTVGGPQVLLAAIQVPQRARGSSLKGLHDLGDLKGEEDVVL